MPAVDYAFAILRAELARSMEQVPPEAQHYCLFGSGVMVLHGLRDQVNDLDVFVTNQLFTRLVLNGWDYNEADWRPPVAELKLRNAPTLHATARWARGAAGGKANIYKLLYEHAEWVNGWRCQPLAELEETYRCAAAIPGRNRRGDLAKADDIMHYLAAH